MNKLLSIFLTALLATVCVFDFAFLVEILSLEMQRHTSEGSKRKHISCIVNELLGKVKATHKIVNKIWKWIGVNVNKKIKYKTMRRECVIHTETEREREMGKEAQAESMPFHFKMTLEWYLINCDHYYICDHEEIKIHSIKLSIPHTNIVWKKINNKVKNKSKRMCSELACNNHSPINSFCYKLLNI